MHETATVPSSIRWTERWIRRAWGLPTGEGFYCDHPSKGSGARRSPAYQMVNEQGNTMTMETATWEEANDALCKIRKYAPGGPQAKDGTREHERRVNCEFGLHEFMRTNYLLKSVVPEGRSDALLSVSLGEDIWHILTVQMSLPRLLLLEVLVEFAFIFAGSAALIAVAVAEGQLVAPGLLGSKLMLSFTTVRISSDAIFGWQERIPSTTPEIAVLALIGWFHWLLLSVAGSIIVARALRPLQQVGFAPDCAMNETEISVRMVNLRRTVMLYDVKVALVCTISGMRYNLPLTNGMTTYDSIYTYPMTFKHDLTAPDSPLNKKNLDLAKFQSIGVSLTATDNAGNPVVAHAMYWNPKAWTVRRREFQNTFTDCSPYPRILRGKWADQVRMYRAPNSASEFAGSNIPDFLFNMDNFHVIHATETDSAV